MMLHKSVLLVDRGRLKAWLTVAGLSVLIGCETDSSTTFQSAGVAAPAFTDVTKESGIGSFRHETGARGKFWMPETMGGGGAFVDYNSDGQLDLLLVRGATWAQDEGVQSIRALELYENTGDGRFVERTDEAGLRDVTAYAFAPIVADFDNDGDDDVYLTTLHRNLLLRNDGGVFAEVGEAAGVAGPEEWSTAAVFFDADLDGWLDLFVGNYVEWSPAIDQPCSLVDGTRGYCTPQIYDGLPGRFYRNRGDGTFTELSVAAGFDDSAPGKTLAAAMLDHNEDGYPDLIVVNDTERDLLYENQGNGSFKEVGIPSGVALDRYGQARAGMGVDVGVMDSTGRPTVFVANFAREMLGVYRYTADGRFADRASSAGVGQASLNSLSFGLFVFDADLDGHLDLFVANGHISPDVHRVDGSVSYRQPAQLYRNAGDGSFELVRPANDDDVWAHPMVARAAAYGDYDADGDPDILIVENGGAAHLWRNDIRERHYLRVHLEGRKSNRNAVGAWVDVHVDGRNMRQYVRTGSSYLASSERTLTFGLGTHAGADSVVIRWPSGRRDVLRDVDANQELAVVEADQELAVEEADHVEESDHEVAFARAAERVSVTHEQITTSSGGR